MRAKKTALSCFDEATQCCSINLASRQRHLQTSASAMTITIEIQAKTNQHLLELASDRPDVLRPRSFRPMPLVVGHSLSFLEFFVAHAFEVRHVEEHVGASASVDETKTLVRQFLDCAFCHLQSDSQKKCLRCAARHDWFRLFKRKRRFYRAAQKKQAVYPQERILCTATVLVGRQRVGFCDVSS